MNQKELLMPLVVNSELLELISSHKSSTNRNTTSSSISAILSTLSQENPSQFKSHPTMDLEMKLIHSDMSSNSCQINQREISSSMLIMTKKYWDLLLDSIQESQKTLIEDLLFHSSYQMIPFLSLNLLKRTLVLLKANF